MAKKQKGFTSKITPIKATKLADIFVSLGFTQTKPKRGGSHILISKPGMLYPITFGNHTSTELPPQTIQKLIKKAGISKEQYLAAFNDLK